MLTPTCGHRVAQGRAWTGTPDLSKGSILAPWGHRDRSLPAGVLKQWEFIFTILEARCPRPRCQQGQAPAEALGGLTLPPSAPGGSRCPLVCGCRAPFSSFLSFFFNLFLAALGLHFCAPALSSWGEQGLLFSYRMRALGYSGSVLVACRLSCPAAREILPDQGWNLCPLHWQGDS